MYNWHKINDFTYPELPSNKITEVSVATKRICLLKKHHTVYAFAATCPHAGANLCDGRISLMGRIVCPLHNYHFDPANGRNTSGEGYKLFTYPVEIRGDAIFVGILAASTIV